MSAKKDFIAAKIAEFKQGQPAEPTPAAQEEANIELEEQDNIASDDSAQELSDECPKELPTWKFNVIQLKCE